jgi:hypothetical protein
MIFSEYLLDKSILFALYYIGLKPAGLERKDEGRVPS